MGTQKVCVFPKEGKKHEFWSDHSPHRKGAWSLILGMLLYFLQNSLLVSVSKDFDVITTCKGHSFHQPWDGRMVVLWCESHRDSRSSYERYWKILYQAGRLRKKSSCPVAVRAQCKWKFLPPQQYRHPSWYSHPLVYSEHNSMSAAHRVPCRVLSVAIKTGNKKTSHPVVSIGELVVVFSLLRYPVKSK